MLPVSKIYAVEVSGACNLERTCVQCPMNVRPRYRPRGIMDEQTVVRSLYWVAKLGAAGVLNLHGFGEPLLHPKFDEIARRFSLFSDITVSTNGVLLDEEWADRLAKIRWKWISVSPWDKEAQKKAVELLSARGIPTMNPPGETHDWAGQAKGPSDFALEHHCPFLMNGHATIRWDGSLASCCITDRYEDSIGHVSAEPGTVKMRGYSICSSCHLNRG